MSSSRETVRFAFNKPGKYRIRVLGLLDNSLSDRLGGLQLMHGSLQHKKGSITELVSVVRDQAELSGVLETLYELHMTLVSVEMLEDENLSSNSEAF